MDYKIEPTKLTERIPSLDYLRGIAVLGILFINIESFVYENPWSSYQYGFQTSLDINTRFWVYFLTQGKFYNMFALLFGVGFVIFLERIEMKNIGLKGIDIYTRRLLWLFVFGVIHAYFIWNGDVLYHYAICGLLLLPFRSIKNKYIIFTIIFLASFSIIKSYTSSSERLKTYNEYNKAIQISQTERTDEQSKKITSWEKRYSKKVASMNSAENPKPTYWEGLKKSYSHATVHQGEFYYQSLLFSTLIIMLLGIVLYREGIFYDFTVWKHYWLISILVLVVGLSINYFRFYHWTFEDHKPVINIWQSMMFTFPKEILGFGYVLVLNGLYQKYLKNNKIKIISKVGRTALSNYILQSIILGFIFYGYGFGMFNEFSRFELLPIVGIIWLIQIALTLIWLKYNKQGPLERLWRKLTYTSFQQIKKNER
jgi:uncharacterized protein